MAIHDVKFTVPERPLGKADITFNVFQNSKKIGTFKVSKGAVVWIPCYGKKTEYKKNWNEMSRYFEGR
jgi:hypothetical protein